MRLCLVVEPLEDRCEPATITVTGLTDGMGSFAGGANPTDTTLRGAITHATSGDTIQFQGGLSGTIDLSPSGLGVLAISTNLTIQGPSNDAITIEGGTTVGATSNVPVFSINSGNVSLNNLVITNGYSSGDGGGIDNNGNGMLTLTNCRVCGNSAKRGGGLEINDGSAVLTNCTVSDNDARSGGGLDDQGTLMLTNCTVSDNRAASSGGGLEISAGSAVLTNCTVSGNYANFGAGLSNSVMLTLTNCTVIDDSATTTGGGLYNLGTAILTNCTVSDNSAGSDGFIGFGGGLEIISGSATLTNCTVSGNSATLIDSKGGGLEIISGSATLTNCNVSGNSAFYGGGLCDQGTMSDQGTLTLSNCTVSGNSSGFGGFVGSGGGLEIISGSATLTNCTVSGNSAYLGGGLYDRGTLTLTLTNCTVSGNSAYYGGGLYNVGTATLINCTVSDNSAISSGGGVFNGDRTSTDGILNIGNTIVAGNTADDSGPDTVGPVDSYGNNLIGITNGSSGWIATDLTGLDARLAPLGDYGGPTQTMALLPGSPAIDAGSNALIPYGISTDQRGLPRIVNNTVDIGAVETGSPTLMTTASLAVTLGPITPTLTDVAVLAAGYLPDGLSSSITFTLKLGATTVYTVADAVTGDGTYSASYRLPTTGPVAGTYTWSARYSGDAENNSASDQGGSAEQTVVNAASPILSTTPTPTEITLDSTPTTLTDTANLERGENPTGTIIFTLYDPHDNLVDTVADAVTGDGTYSASYRLPTTGPVAGTYTWSARYSGDAANNSASDQGGSAEQTVVSAASPTLSTTPTPTEITFDGGPTTFTDTANLAGGDNPTGIITFTLYDPHDNLVDTETATVRGNGIYGTSAGYTLPSTGTVTGTYRWDATYSGDGDNTTASDNNDTAEQVSVNPATPTVSVTDPGGIYTSDPFPVTAATVTGVGADGTLASLRMGSGPLSFSYYAVDAALIASYRSDNGNYTNVNSTVIDFNIQPATPPISVTDPGGTYTGDPFPVTAATVTGVGSEGTLASLSMGSGPLSFTYYAVDAASTLTPIGSAPTAVGRYAVIASYKSVNGNYTNVNSIVIDFNIKPATPPVSVADPGGTYTSDPFPVKAAAVTGVGGDGVLATLARESGTLSFVYYSVGAGGLLTPIGSVAPSAVGSYAVIASYTSNNVNYMNATSPATDFSITLGTAPVGPSEPSLPDPVVPPGIVPPPSAAPARDTTTIPPPSRDRTVLGMLPTSAIDAGVSSQVLVASLNDSDLWLPSPNSLFPQPELPLPAVPLQGEKPSRPPVLPLDPTVAVPGFSNSGGDSLIPFDELDRAARVRSLANDHPVPIPTAPTPPTEDTTPASPLTTTLPWWLVGAFVTGVAVATQTRPTRRCARWVARTFHRLVSPQSPSQGQP